MYSSYQRLLKKHNIDKNLRAQLKKGIFQQEYVRVVSIPHVAQIFLIFSAKLVKKAAKMRYIS